MNSKTHGVVIVDYGLGNLFSVQHACEYVGIHAEITSERKKILDADGVILPGVGAFQDAMAALQRRDLIAVLKEAAAADKPLMGICLGLQLLMEESNEFGPHKGLSILKGNVVRFESPRENNRLLKVPQIGWNQIYSARPWTGTPLEGQNEGECMYFVHSFIAQPSDSGVILSKSQYGHIQFCSSVARGNLFACQFHPEKSGPAGLKIYENFSAICSRKAKETVKHGS